MSYAKISKEKVISACKDFLERVDERRREMERYYEEERERKLAGFNPLTISHNISQYKHEEVRAIRELLTLACVCEEFVDVSRQDASLIFY